mgnify:CR=1 FL=1
MLLFSLFSAGMFPFITLLKSVILINYYCHELKCFFYLEGTEYCFTTLTFYLILIAAVFSGLTVVPH